MNESTLSSKLAPEDIAFLAGDSRILARGRDLFLGRRFRLTCVADDSAEAIVEGTRAYQVRLAFDAEGPYSECTCPYAAEWGSCKHGVAVALGYVEAIRGGTPAAPASSALVAPGVSVPAELERLPLAALVDPTPSAQAPYGSFGLSFEELAQLEAAGIASMSAATALRGGLPATLSQPLDTRLRQALLDLLAEPPFSPRLASYDDYDHGPVVRAIRGSIRQLAQGERRAVQPGPKECALSVRLNEAVPVAEYSELRPALDPDGRLVQPRVSLRLGPGSKLGVTCSCSPGRQASCEHARSAAAQLHQWTSGKGSRSLEAAAKLDPWQRALDSMPSVEPAARPGRELCFHLRLAWDGTTTVMPLAHARRRGGALGKGNSPSAADLEGFRPQLSGDEFRALELLLAIGNGGPARLESGRLLSERALLLLGGSSRVVDAELRPVTVRVARLSVVVEGEANQDVRVRVLLEGRALEGGLLEQLASHDTRRSCLASFEASTATLSLVKCPARAEWLRVLAGDGVVVPRSSLEAFVGRLPRLAEEVEVKLPAWLEATELAPGEDRTLRLEALPGAGLRASFLISPLGGDLRVPIGQPPELIQAWSAQRRALTRRDLERERVLTLADRQALGLPATTEPQVTLGDDAAALALLKRLEPPRDGLEVEWVDRPLRFRRYSEIDQLRLAVAQGQDWFGLRGALDDLELSALLDAVRRDLPFLRDGESIVELSDALKERLRALADAAHRSTHGEEISPVAVPFLAELREHGAQVELPPDLEALEARIRGARRSAPVVPRALRAKLRDYQADGFRWMARLAAWGGGGCLADDMGLGKTVQALALLLARAKEGPALVAAPTSVCFNWEREAARFSPSLKVVSHRGKERGTALAGLGRRAVVLTSHVLLSRDAEALSKVRWATLIVDEAQAFKNPESQRAKALWSLTAQARFALTGTPIENRLSELWSLFRFLFPGYLGSQEWFRRQFAAPIEAGQDPGRKARLKALVRPFLLRRTKQEVARELPARTEVVDTVSLSMAELQLYEDARRAALFALTQGKRDDEPKYRFDVLAALTRLRMLACHPKLVDPRTRVESSKLERLVELVNELSSEAHRVLVFSQFVKQLELVRAALVEQGHRVLVLEGKTTPDERRARVDAFQRGEADCFLISLRAGGFGLNLTEADHVIHLDPWWNPAVEDQASDRTHRIGQLKPVTVIRLVARGTIEEQILALHDKKRALVEAVLDGSANPGRIDTEELLELLRQSTAAAA